MVNHKATKKRNPVGSVGRDICLKYFFFFLVAKMAPIKTQIIFKKSDVFLKKILEKYSQLLSKNFSQIFFDFGQKWLILHVFNKLKEKISQKEKSGSVVPVKQGFLFSWPNEANIVTIAVGPLHQIAFHMKGFHRYP